MIELKKAEPRDCGAIHTMQVEAFAELLEKYRDARPPVSQLLIQMAQLCLFPDGIQPPCLRLRIHLLQRPPRNICDAEQLFPRLEGEASASAVQRGHLHLHGVDRPAVPRPSLFQFNHSTASDMCNPL